MTEREINDFCKENKFDIEEFKNCRFILKYPEKFKKFINKQQQKFERELLNQKGLFQWERLEIPRPEKEKLIR